MKRCIFGVIIFCYIGLSACNLPIPSLKINSGSAAQMSPRAWIDAPLNESNLPLEPYEIVFHITDQQSPLQGELSINEQVVTTLTNPDPTQKLATLKYMWSPDAPGKYILAVRAYGANGNWGEQTSAAVYIGEMTPTITATQEVTATITTTPTPTQTAGFSAFSASPNAVHFGNCTPNQVTVQTQAFDPAGITTVVLYYRMRDENGQSTEWINSNMIAEVNDQYKKTLNLDTFSSPYQNGTLDIQLVIQNKNGALIRSQVYSDVSISGCLLPLNIIKITPKPIIPFIKTNTPIIIK